MRVNRPYVVVVYHAEVVVIILEPLLIFEAAARREGITVVSECEVGDGHAGVFVS